MVPLSFIWIGYPTKSYKKKKNDFRKGYNEIHSWIGSFPEKAPLDFIDVSKNQMKKRVVSFEPPCDLQPIVCLNIITWSQRYSLFPILSSLIEPSLRNFRITLSNGLFSSVGIGKSIPFLRTVLESFLSHTAQQSILLASHLHLLYLTELYFS
jgi:hypothetical protein